MTKLKLDLNALSVESFDTTDAGRGLAGTVRAHDSGEPTTGNDVCESEVTCDNGWVCLPQSTLAPSCGGQFSCKCTGDFCGG